MGAAFRLTPEILLHAYAAGIFPMAEAADDPELFWVDPTRRGIIPLDDFHLPRRLARAFFGESMFSRVTDASKVALVGLVVRLRAGGFRLLDTQFLTPHLAQFGGIEISRARYHRLLADALRQRADFPRVLPGDGEAGGTVAAGGAGE